jgi:hypothetical protein
MKNGDMLWWLGLGGAVKIRLEYKFKFENHSLVTKWTDAEVHARCSLR